MSLHLEFENGSKISYNDVKTLGVEYGREFVQNNDTIGPDEIGNGFVQNNNITLNGGIVDNGFASMDNETRNGFVQNNLVLGGWVSSG